ncbi:ribbon-helix-helix protein, CopG family [Nitrosomonas communis]|uniref:Ribbon-helix-helix protein, copG family n=1 Tax=Nitrosomonas communis TaxID=44574 RepID=A0A1I4UDX6_9PROT|nr:ribbon-helix-helix protein, CopG family [Nitrosomonas communis]SFM87030.1 Ribbon-helix-helix protein, copG family [Nitrosomonas communis]
MSNMTFSNQRSSTLPVVLPISWIDRLTQLARERGINRSALVREVLQQTLFNDDKTTLTDDTKDA